MSEIRRLDNCNLDQYVDYLEKNGIVPNKTTLRTVDSKFKNVAGMDIKDIPAFCDNNIRLQKEVK